MKYQNGFAHAFIIVGLIAVLVGALSVVFWKNFIERKGPSGNTTSSHINKPNTITNVMPDDGGIPTSWATYSESDYPVRFRYPAEWSIVHSIWSDGVKALVAHNGDVKSTDNLVFAATNTLSGSDETTNTCPSKLPDKVSSCEKYTTRYMDAVIWEHTDTPEYLYSARINNDFYIFNVKSNAVDKQTFKKILQTVAPRY